MTRPLFLSTYPGVYSRAPGDLKEPAYHKEIQWKGH